MIDFFITVILISSLAAYVLTLMRKWGIVEQVQVNGNDFFAKMFSCDFCLSWWIGVIISVTWYLATGDCNVLFVPFFSTMITRYIL